MNVFTYGTLMDAEIMRAVCGKAYSAQAATLPGYYRRVVRGECYPAISARVGEVVHGVVYCGLTAASLARLDSFEGDLYERSPVLVIGLDGDNIAADSYIINSDAQHYLSAEEWSFDEFITHYKQSFVREYVGYNQI